MTQGKHISYYYFTPDGKTSTIASWRDNVSERGLLDTAGNWVGPSHHATHSRHCEVRTMLSSRQARIQGWKSSVLSAVYSRGVNFSFWRTSPWWRREGLLKRRDTYVTVGVRMLVQRRGCKAGPLSSCQRMPTLPQVFALSQCAGLRNPNPFLVSYKLSSNPAFHLHFFFGSPGAGVPGTCEPPNTGAGHGTWVLSQKSKSSITSRLPSPLSQLFIVTIARLQT